MTPRRVLLLGGSTEAADLTRRLADERPDLDLTVSFAGRTDARGPVPDGTVVRVGGFGGIEGLVRHLAFARIDAVVDATHPFARIMPFHVEAACRELGVASVRVLRPAWVAGDGDQWIEVDDMPAAAHAVLDSSARRVLLTVGRQELAAFAPCASRSFIVRSIDPPPAGVLPDVEVVLARGPFSLDDELELLRSRAIELVVSKNSGGDATRAKVDAARQLHVPIVMVRRPAGPAVPTVGNAAEALAWLDEIAERAS